MLCAASYLVAITCCFDVHVFRHHNPHRQFVVLAIEKPSIYGVQSNIAIYRPSTGAQEMNRHEFKEKYSKVICSNALS